MNRFETTFGKDSDRIVDMLHEHSGAAVFTLFCKIKELCAEYYTSGYDDCSIIEEGEYTK